MNLAWMVANLGTDALQVIQRWIVPVEGRTLTTVVPTARRARRVGDALDSQAWAGEVSPFAIEEESEFRIKLCAGRGMPYGARTQPNRTSLDQ